ncbi:MAG TPA: RNA polymerase sigma factor [Gemmatimonadaceae bacterium]|nr:RNA polymerase sigma factor [Gemmatimonadaceae bacterium]
MPPDDALSHDVPGRGSLAALAARAQLGDRGALEELLRGLQPPLGDYIRGIVRDDDRAADVLQDVLIIICRRLGTVRETEWIRAWAYRIATREAHRSIRRSRRFRQQPLEDLSDLADSSSGEPGTGDEELLAELPARLAAVPAAAQVVLRMHYLLSLTQLEIAEALEIPIGTVKSRLAYGLQCLRRNWKPPP